MNKALLCVLVAVAVFSQHTSALLRPSRHHATKHALEETSFKEKAHNFFKNQAYVHIGGINDDIGKCAPSGPWGYWLGNSYKAKVVLGSAPFMSGPKADFRKFLAERDAAVLLDLVEVISKLAKSKPRTGYNQAMQSQLCYKTQRLDLNPMLTTLSNELAQFCRANRQTVRTAKGFKEAVKPFAEKLKGWYEMYWHEYNVEGGAHQQYMHKANRWRCGASSGHSTLCMKDEILTAMYDYDDFSVHLDDRNLELWEHMKKFAKKEWSVENMLLVEDAAKLVATIRRGIDESAKQAFFDKFLATGAPSEVNTSKKNIAVYQSATSAVALRNAVTALVKDATTNISDTFSRYRYTKGYKKRVKGLPSCAK